MKIAADKVVPQNKLARCLGDGISVKQSLRCLMFVRTPLIELMFGLTPEFGGRDV